MCLKSVTGVTYIMGFRTRILKYSLIALIFVAITIGNASATGYIHIIPEKTTGLSTGDTFTLTINVDAQGDYLKAIDTTLNYNADTLKIVKITEEGIFGTDMLALPGSEDDGYGIIKYAIASTDKSGYQVFNSKFLTFEFQVKDDAEDGIFFLNFKEIRLIDENSNDLSGKATGSVIFIGDTWNEDDANPEIVNIGPEVKSTATTSTTGSMTSPSQSKIEYNYIFGSNPNDYEITDRRGVAESSNDNVIILQNKLKTIFENKHFYPHGKIMSMGTNSDNYLVVVFYKPLIEQADTNDIYSIIETEAKTMGFDNVPVEFGSGTDSQITDTLQDLIGNSKAMNKLSLAALTDEKSSVYEPSVIKTVGKLPKIETEKECWQWFFQDSYRISQNSGLKLEPYIQNGMILSIGVSTNGYFEVRINEETNMDRESFIDDIYQTIDDEGEKNGISEVPVIFRLSTPSDKETLESPIEESAEDEEMPLNEAENTPGFGLISGIVALAIAYYQKDRSAQHK